PLPVEKKMDCPSAAHAPTSMLRCPENSRRCPLATSWTARSREPQPSVCTLYAIFVPSGLTAAREPYGAILRRCPPLIGIVYIPLIPGSQPLVTPKNTRS